MDISCDIIRVQEGETERRVLHVQLLKRQVKNMNAEMNFTKGEINLMGKERGNVMDEMKEMKVVAENCNCSFYSLATVAGGVLLAIGTVIYSLITM